MRPVSSSSTDLSISGSRSLSSRRNSTGHPPSVDTVTPVNPIEDAAPTHWTHPALTRNARNDDAGSHAQIEQLISRRLTRLALSGALPPRMRHAHAAATAMVDLFVLLGWPGDLCLSLAKDRSLWEAFLLTTSAPVFEQGGVTNGPHGGPTLRRPFDRQVTAAVIGALLERDKFAEAQGVLGACPLPLDKRVVVKWLLKRHGQAMNRLQSSDAAIAFEPVLKDMLNHHRDKYVKLQPAIETLLAHWHPPEPPRLSGIEAALAERGSPITVDERGVGQWIVAQGTTIDPSLLDLLLAYLRLSLQHPDSAGPAAGVLCDALAHMGAVVSVQGRPVLDQNGGEPLIQRQIRSMNPERRQHLASFARQCIAVLLAHGRHLALTRTLVFLCLCLKDPGLTSDAESRRFTAELRGDTPLERATRDAVSRDGLLSAWLLTQELSLANLKKLIDGDLRHWAHAIQSPRAALQFLQDVMHLLSSLRPSAASPDSAPRMAWRLARQSLLSTLVTAFAHLVRDSADPLLPEWACLAQWAWVTDATLSLLQPDEDALPPRAATMAYAPCLTVFATQGPALHLTLNLLCKPPLLQVPAILRLNAMVLVFEMFAQCRTETRLDVLRLPLPKLWLSLPPVLDIDTFFKQNPLPLEQQLDQVGQLAPFVRDGFELANLSSFLEHLLEAANVTEFIQVVNQTPCATAWAANILHTFRLRLDDSDKVIRPRGLPALLMWLQRIALDASTEGTQGRWSNWLEFLCACASRKAPREPLSAQDWFILGAWLPLDPRSAVAGRQITQLANGLQHPKALAYLLLSWLRQRLAEGASAPFGEPAAPAVSRQLFLDVVKRTKALITCLPRAEQAELKNELKTLGIEYAALKKK